MAKWDAFNRARARRPKGAMTEAEEAYSQRLGLLERAEEILWSRYKPGSLRLADGLRYEPDFAYVDKTMELVYVEVKGPAGWKSDHSGKSRTKWLTAADLFWWARFECAVLNRRSAWEIEVYERKTKA